MNKMPKTAWYEALFSRKSRLFGRGNNVDIVGVTGSIPVTPTIRSPCFSGLLALPSPPATYFPLGSLNLGDFGVRAMFTGE